MARILPGGEVQEAGHAIWVVSATPLPFVNGVIRYDATDFQGPESEHELDSCLAVLSTYDMPWRFRAWAHLGADVLVPRLIARGMTKVRIDQAMWLDLPVTSPADLGGPDARDPEDEPTGRPARAGLDGIDVRPATSPSEYRAWTKIFTRSSDVPSQHAELVEKVVAMPQGLSLVARANRRPVGCLTLAFEEDLAVVHHVGIPPSARRLGVGRRLLMAAHEAAAARGMRACVVLASPDGFGVCARLGHQAVTSLTYLSAPPSLAVRATA
jgi:predicted N-acetyltransferase YhbS